MVGPAELPIARIVACSGMVRSSVRGYNNSDYSLWLGSVARAVASTASPAMLTASGPARSYACRWRIIQFG